MKNFIITEKQELILQKILKEEIYNEPGPQSISMKKTNRPFCINPDKVLIVKKFLDKGFTPHDYEKIGCNGLPMKIKVFSMNASNGDTLKWLYKDQLQDLLIDRFQNMFSDINERELFMKQVINDWINNKISIFGGLSKNSLSENFINESSLEEIDNEANNVNTSPTEAQKEAGNYKMGHISIKGMKISIENPKGSYRKGIDDKGKAWKTKMKNHYGYFTNTTGNGKDGDAVDVFIGPNIENFKNVYVVDQKNKSGDFDESKVMLGFNSKQQAKEAYLSNYSSNWKGFQYITGVPLSTFKRWLYRGHKQRKPFKEYISIKKEKINECRLINEEEYNEIHSIAKMNNEKETQQVIDKLIKCGIDAYTEGNNIINIRIERDKTDDYYVEFVLKNAKKIIDDIRFENMSNQ